jgi:hypothetical protein
VRECVCVRESVCVRECMRACVCVRGVGMLRLETSRNPPPPPPPLIEVERTRVPVECGLNPLGHVS